ncbi:MAG: hypothetical protein EOO60_09330 [Hymenobacter sp.]|nr:MAG: hypothetical protein EOO60_09330 [Hymenobacter sp.]
MLVLRRVRRRLLLPPGWVALGFLLLLGCQALRPWQGQLRQWTMIQLTMPPLTISSFAGEKPGLYARVTNQSRWQLNRFRPWYDIKFKGQALPDSQSAAATEAAIRKIIADTKYAGGVRVRFLPGATYANLVRVLDIMKYTGQRKYWLDTRYQPVTLYAITDNVSVTAKTAAVRLTVIGCLLCGDVLRSSPTPIAHQSRQLLADFWQEIVGLLERVWRQPLLLLLVISGLSLWRLLHAE